MNASEIALELDTLKAAIVAEIAKMLSELPKKNKLYNYLEGL
jgi:hypothetical protein